jgi:hypothetical protein
LGDRAIIGAKNLGIRAANERDNLIYQAKVLEAKLSPAMATPEGIPLRPMPEPPTQRPLIPVPEKQQPLRMEGAPEGTQGAGTQSKSQPKSKDTTTGHEEPTSLGQNGRFQDSETENAYQAYIKRNEARGREVRDRLNWQRESDFYKNGPMGRGNKFNDTVRERRDYDFSEVHLENGKRLDSYRPSESGRPGEIVSRKAIDFDNVGKDTDFTAHLREMKNKYEPGTKIRSNKYDDLDGTTIEGRQILEVPSTNMNSTKRAHFEKLAAEQGIEIRYTDEH